MGDLVLEISVSSRRLRYRSSYLGANPSSDRTRDATWAGAARVQLYSRVDSGEGVVGTHGMRWIVGEVVYGMCWIVGEVVYGVRWTMPGDISVLVL